MNLLKSRKFWYAIVGLALNIVAWLVPDIPTEVRASMSTVLTAIVGVLIGAHAYTDSAALKMEGAKSIAKAIEKGGGLLPSDPTPKGQA